MRRRRRTMSCWRRQKGALFVIYSASGRDVHELYCCACGEWIGDALDPDIEHVSEPLDAECAADMR